MRISHTLAVSTLAVLLAGTASAQESSSEHHDGSSAETYPEVCRKADGRAEEQMAPQAGMNMQNMENMQDHQRTAMEGMMEMRGNMIQGMMADDADVAFACGMIAHHQGAIDMAQVELEYGDDASMKETAEEIIAAQTREIAEMKAWLEENVQ